MKKVRVPNTFNKKLEKEANRQNMTLEELEGLIIGLLSKDMKP